jgi:LysM repeat protein
MRYMVRPGDSLSKIANAHGLGLAQVLAANPQFRANPDGIRVGDVVEIPDGAPPMPPAAAVTPTPAAGAHHQLGKLSEQFETGGRGPGTVSSGVGDAGGVSYGSYQMTSKNGGTVGQFVSKPDFRWRDDFRGRTPGSPEFTAKWKAIAAASPEPFQAAQHAYIKATHFDVLVEDVRNDDGLDVTTRSAALQDVVWSTAVQHGPNSPVVHRAFAVLRNQGGQNANAPDFDRALIKAIYAERGRRDAEGKLVYFAKNSPAVQDGVAKRFVREEREALRMLDST